MVGDPQPSDRINSFSLVCYVPGELAEFLDDVRRQLQEGCTARSHVTVLPPRSLDFDFNNPEKRRRAASDLRRLIEPLSPFKVEFPKLNVFEGTLVIYAEVLTGREELLEIHDKLNRGQFEQCEGYRYHPHITLAQEIPPERFSETFDLAKRLWNRPTLPRHFVLDNLTFVQNTVANRWVDLADYEMRGLTEATFR